MSKRRSAVFASTPVILTAKAFLDRTPVKASDEQIERAMSSVMCRCFTHTRMLRAIEDVTPQGMHALSGKPRKTEASIRP